MTTFARHDEALWHNKIFTQGMKQMNYYSLLRCLLFTLPPEFSHYASLRGLKVLTSLGLRQERVISTTPVPLLGMYFPNRLGLAAGLDKNGDYLAALSTLGLGFIELGTVTPVAQPGNVKPRLFRIPKAKALINRMGFNNKGIDYLIEQLQHSARSAAKIGINIGKNANTLDEDAINDYLIGMQRAYPWADYITINISSPNTRNLRDLQYGAVLSELLEKLKQEQQSLAEKTGVYKPLLVKIAPDMGDIELKWFAEQARYWQIDGIIATNTTIDRAGLEKLPRAKEAGGLSGQPLSSKSTHSIQLLRQELGAGFPIIGVGGIMSVADAQAKISAGADLLQIYTGLIYQGPGLVKKILKNLP